MMDSPITGATLKAWGYPPGAWYPDAIREAEAARAGGAEETAIRAVINGLAPPPGIPLRALGTLPFYANIECHGDAEVANVKAVLGHMHELMRVPTLVAGAVMPDACPSGSAPGTIPVGGVVAAKDAIHPGFHSADICCSMACTVFEDADPTALLDAGMRLSHFGGGGRARGAQIVPASDILAAFEANTFLADKVSMAIAHHCSSGDGNHFVFVGRLASEGKIALVTHHGSRKPGAMLYKDGMAAARRARAKLSPETPEHNAWIPSETAEGDAYWSALQIVRAWTKSNHFTLHDLIADALGLRRWHRFWNEHNFVFRKADGLFYHAKGATPAFPGYAADASGQTLIPLNMGAPILVTEGSDEPRGLGFAPHGAGRNFSRTAYMRTLSGDGSPRVSDERIAEIVREQTPGLDVRFFCGHPDISELPGAYKDAETIRAQIEGYGLARVVDTIEPIGSIMAGDWERDAPWRKKRERKAAAAVDPQADAT